jgi:uncharacterized membrane protein
MQWFFIALLAHVLWATVNLADQYLVEQFRKKDAPQITLIMFAAPIALVVGIIVGAFSWPQMMLLSSASIGWLLFAGVIQVIGIWLYLKALLHSNAANVSAWFLLMPVIALFGGFVVLGESLTFVQIIGMGSIILGAFIFSLHYHKESNTHSIPWKTIGFMFGSSIALVFADILFKKGVVLGAMYWPALSIIEIGTAIIGFLLLFIPSLRKAFFNICIEQGKQVFMVNATTEVITMVGNALKAYAVLLVPVALVASMEGYQPIIVFLLSIPLAYFLPKYFSFEENTKWHVFLKIVGAVLLIIGTYLLV